MKYQDMFSKQEYEKDVLNCVLIIQQFKDNYKAFMFKVGIVARKNSVILYLHKQGFTQQYPCKGPCSFQ